MPRPEFADYCRFSRIERRSETTIFPGKSTRFGSSSPRWKNKALCVDPKSPPSSALSHPGRGAYRDRHERGVRCGGRGWHQVRCKARGRMEPPADGEVVWFWHPDADAKSANTIRGRRWQESPVTGKSTKETVKTIAQGRPDCLGEPVVTKLVCFLFCTRGCGCGEHPAFPAPSFCWRA
jgi:hypothetical protein